MSSMLRPDERAANAEIERDRNLKSNLSGLAKTAVGIGAAGIGGALSSRIAPFLNEYITPELAVKGISKISPKLGNFLKQGQEMGLDVKEGINFLKDKLDKPKDSRNIIQQYSDELYSFLDQNIKNGKRIIEAVIAAEMNPKFKKIVNQIELDHITPFTKIAQSIFKENEGQKKDSSNEQNQRKQGIVNQVLQQSQQMQSQNSQQQQMQPQNPQQQQGQGAANLMAILEKIQKQRGAR